MRESLARTVRDVKGREHSLQLDQTGDRHVRHGWVGTVHGSQGATADRSMVHLESFRSNTVDARSPYVAISRARKEAIVYTDSRAKLADAIELRSGERTTALVPEKSIDRSVVAVESPTSSRGLALGPRLITTT